MASKFDLITGTDDIFKNPEYISDSVIFNSIESARNDDDYKMYSDHRSVIISTSGTGNRVWIWTSSSIKNNTDKLIDICRFLRDLNIPKVEIYLKQDVSGNFSDLYALATLEINYIVKDEFSLGVYTYKADKITDTGIIVPAEDEKIILVDKANKDHIALVTDFYKDCREEFRWQEKFERKVQEYLDMEMYALVKNGRMIANAAIGSPTEKYLRIKSVAVLKDERRKGYGYKMCSFVVNKILEKGTQPMLYTHVGNTAAMALWKKTGFKEHNRLCLLKIEEDN